ncbi:kelch-like protein diablo [Biomphalaria glabrata]|uniref:Kelch-like protein diablo n=1 Tax=Biomphalaria glabrata TaxID=6526 RepID=A0A9W2Z0F1_BIOGL|nr:kelch-like protein diablo [Biomphalaria glabrata]
MEIKREVAYGIVQGLSDFWKCEELQDFTVILGTRKFACHGFLLAACSGFFRGLFRSGMKETELKCVTVEDISSETFELILETLYTGHGVLTNDSIIDIWEAAQQLQIPFLITECEGFAKATLSLDNYIEYYKTAKLFNSKEVLDIVWSFILKNTISFFQTDFFLEMPISDVLKLIKSQDLEVPSEDAVVYFLYKWLEFKPGQEDDISENSDKECMCLNSGEKRIRTGYNSFETSENKPPNNVITNDASDDNRKQYLCDLMSNTRTCLFSPECLEKLISHPLIRESKEATDIIIEALFYQFQVGKRNGQWPPGAIYRNNGNFINAAVAICQNTNDAIVQVKAFSFVTKQWLQLPCLYSNSSVAFVAFDTSLYAIGESVAAYSRGNLFKTQLLKLTNTSWSEVNVSFNLPSDPRVVVADAFIYILSNRSREVWQLDPTAGTASKKTNLMDRARIYHVTSHKHFLLAFFIKDSPKKITAVACFNVSQNTWVKLQNIKGPAQGMISFKQRLSTFLLQTNGNLWRVGSKSNDVKIKKVTKLWSCDWSPHGAVTFRDELYIYGVKSEALEQDSQKQCSLGGIFNQIVYMESGGTASSTFIPLTLSRQCLIKM